LEEAKVDQELSDDDKVAARAARAKANNEPILNIGNTTGGQWRAKSPSPYKDSNVAKSGERKGMITKSAIQRTKDSIKRRLNKEESELDESRNQADKFYDEAEKHKADAKKHPVGSEKHHYHMANHFDAMHRYHSDIGQHSAADKAADKAELHHEKSLQASKKGLSERAMSDAEMKKREDIVKGMKKNVASFKDKYGDRAKEVMYATATKMAMKEESTMDEQAPVAPSLMKHRISVTVSDPNHTAVSKRKEKIQKTVIVTHSDNKEGARAVGEKFYKKKGYRIHDSHHAGMVNEEISEGFRPGQTVKYETSKYNKDNKGTVVSHKGETVTVKHKDMLGKEHHLEVHQSMVRKEEFELSEEQLDERNKENALKRKMMDASRGARYKVQNKLSGDDVRDWDGKHPTPQAQNKAIGRALRNEDLDEAKKDDVPFDGPYKKVQGDGTVKDKSGAVHTPMSRARDLARQAMKKQMKEAFDLDITDEQADSLVEAANPEQLDELSKGTLSSYVKKSSSKQFAAGHKAATADSGTEMKAINKAQKRSQGVAKAVDRLTKEELGFDEEGNLVAEKKTYTQFVEQLVEYETKSGVYRHKGSYGSSYQGDDDDDEDKPKKPAEPAVKRGRGRPAGSKSGANQKVGSGKSYGGIAHHTLNLPTSK